MIDKKVYSVSKINNYIKNMFDTDFLLKNINIEGEVSNCVYNSSGHIYFKIKDADSSISCALFSNKRDGLDFKLEDGQKVVVNGKITVYEKTGSYQVYVNKVSLSGKGDLYEEFLKLKQKFEDLGMFDDNHKKDIPRYARKIGIVTSDTGAAIKDIINVAKRRNPYVNLYISPCKVQGDDAANDIVRALKIIDDLNMDIIIVGRGGGSIEDLWCFNDEKVAKAIFDAKTPIISAVGHERDFVISDFVSDLRAPTPSAAAELAVFSYDDFLDDIKYYENTLKKNLSRRVDILKSEMKYNKERLTNLFFNTFNTYNIKLENYDIKLNSIISAKLDNTKNRFLFLNQRLDDLSPTKRMLAGYSFVSDKNNKTVKSVSQIKIGDDIDVNLSDGKLECEVKKLSFKA